MITGADVIHIRVVRFAFWQDVRTLLHDLCMEDVLEFVCLARPGRDGHDGCILEKAIKQWNNKDTHTTNQAFCPQTVTLAEIHNVERGLSRTAEQQ